MRQAKLISAAMTLLVIVSAIVLNGKSLKLYANSGVCDVSILRGGYGTGTTGLINTSNSAKTIGTFVPFAEAVRFVFDGHGNLFGTATADFGGSISPVQFTGIYTVKSDCTGNLAASVGGSTIHRDLVIVDGGKEVEFVSTDPGLVIAGSTKKQFNDD